MNLCLNIEWRNGMGMEVVLSSLVCGCLAYLISEINGLQKNVQKILIQIAILEAMVPKRRDD